MPKRKIYEDGIMNYLEEKRLKVLEEIKPIWSNMRKFNYAIAMTMLMFMHANGFDNDIVNGNDISFSTHEVTKLK